MILNIDELSDLLNCQEVLHRDIGWTSFISPNETLFDDFFKTYQEKNDLDENDLKILNSIKIKVSKLLKNHQDLSRELKLDMENTLNSFYKKLAIEFSRLPKPITWYDNNFWLLYNFNYSHKCTEDWEGMTSTPVMSKYFQKNLVNFLWKNRQPNLLNSLNNYFSKIKFSAPELIVPYHKLALKHKDDLILKSPSSGLMEQLELFMSFEKQGHLKACEILSLFNPEVVKEKIKELYEEKKNDIFIVQKLEKILKGIGINVKKEDESSVIIEESQYFPVIDRKILNVKNIIKKEQLNKTKVVQLKDLLQKILSYELRNYCSQTNVALNNQYYLSEKSSPILVLEIEIKTDNKINHEKSLNLFNYIIEYYTGDFFQNKFLNYSLSDLNTVYRTNEIMKEFSEDLKKISLKNSLESSLGNIEEKNRNKYKI